MMIENSQQTRQAGASIESFRNEMVKANMATLTGLMNAQKNNKKLGKDK